MIKVTISDRATQVRFFRFLVSGGIVMVVQLGTLAAFVRWCNDTGAFAGSYAVAVIAHYCLNRFWALRSARTDYKRQTAEYALTVTASFLINFGLFQGAVRWFCLPAVWAALVTNLPTTLLVFLALNFRVFRT